MEVIAEMNKQEVSDFLGISVRSVERYAEKGKLPCRYENAPRGGTVAVFEPEHVELFKREMEAARNAPRRIVTTTGGLAKRNVEPQQLATLATTLATLLQKSPEKSDFPHPDKLTLSIGEASQLSGLSKRFLKAEIEAGRLKKVDRISGLRISRQVLEKFVSSL
jgi:hypothetical protein